MKKLYSFVNDESYMVQVYWVDVTATELHLTPIFSPDDRRKILHYSIINLLPQLHCKFHPHARRARAQIFRAPRLRI
jgi:hypothetical protein